MRLWFAREISDVDEAQHFNEMCSLFSRSIRKLIQKRARNPNQSMNKCTSVKVHHSNEAEMRIMSSSFRFYSLPFHLKKKKRRT